MLIHACSHQAKDAHVGAVKSYSLPPAPQAPALPADLAGELSAWDAAEPTFTASAAPAAESDAAVDGNKADALRLELRGLRDSFGTADAQRRKLEGEVEAIRDDRARLKEALIETTRRIDAAATRVDEGQKRLDTLTGSEDAIRRSLAARREVLGEILAVLQRHEVVASAVNDARDILGDPHFRDRTLVELTGSDVLGRVLMPGPVLHLAGSGEPVYDGVPAIGQHTDEVLAGMLGLDDADRGRLRAAGVTAARRPR